MPPLPPVPEALENALAVDPERWVFVTAVRDGAGAGVATGRFIKEENKIDIELVGAKRVVLHLDMIGVDLDRRIVLRINGKNSELNRRHYPLLTLELSDGGAWLAVDDTP